MASGAASRGRQERNRAKKATRERLRASFGVMSSGLVGCEVKASRIGCLGSLGSRKRGFMTEANMAEAPEKASINLHFDCKIILLPPWGA